MIRSGFSRFWNYFEMHLIFLAGYIMVHLATLQNPTGHTGLFANTSSNFELALRYLLFFGIPISFSLYMISPLRHVDDKWKKVLKCCVFNYIWFILFGILFILFFIH